MREALPTRGPTAETRTRPASMTTAHDPPPHHRRRLPAIAIVALVVLAVALAAAACGGSSGGETTLHVMGASSLTEAFTKLGATFETAHPGVKVVFDFAGSQDLVAQLKQGAPADVLACADTSTMAAVGDLVGDPQVFAGNTLAIVVEPGDPQQVEKLADLARPGLKVVLADPAVPAGKYAQQILARAGVEVKPVSLEESVKGVITKVSLGEADAGIAYVTDVDASAGKVEGVTIPAADNVLATYPIATVDASEHRDDAQAFVDLVLSADGQRILGDFGFLPPAKP